MKAIRITRHGGPDALELEDIAAPGDPGPAQAVVRIHAAGVNFMDVAQRSGLYPRTVPFIPGVEGAGVVTAAGEGVGNVAVSDRVAFSGQPGAYAEQIVLDARWLIPLPAEFTFEQGAAFPLQGMTAQFLLHQFRAPKPGEFVLVHAAAGGVGGLLVQWAIHLGATVIGTVSNEEKVQSVREAGAMHAIIYTREDFAAETMRVTDGHGADLIFDSVGQTTFERNLDAVAERGHIISCGASSGAPGPIAPRALMRRSVSLSGSGAWARTPEEMMARADQVIAAIRGGWLKPNIHAVLPLYRARVAHELLESRNSIGKIILGVASPH